MVITTSSPFFFSFFSRQQNQQHASMVGGKVQGVHGQKEMDAVDLGSGTSDVGAELGEDCRVDG